MSKELNKAPVEQAGGDERDFQAKGAQEVPSPVSQEYDRHLISLLRKGEALPGHQEEAADEIERLRDWNDHLNNTVLPNILNPTFLMLMKGGERLLDLCTKDGEFIGVSLNDMKDVFDWMVTHARIAPDQAALAQPSHAPELAERGTQHRFSTTEQTCRHDFAGVWWNDNGVAQTGRECRHCGFFVADVTKAQAEQAEAERPEVVATMYTHHDDVDFREFVVVGNCDKGCEGFYGPEKLMTVAQHERIVKAWIERWKAYIELSAKIAAQRDAALAEVERIKTISDNYYVLCVERQQQLDAALARVAELEKQERQEVAEVAFVLRNIGAMDAEDIDGDNVDLRFEDAEGRDTGCDVSIVEYAEKAADLFEQHDRIVGELRADRDSWAEQAEQRLADWDEMRKERDAALAKVERLRESKGDPSGSFDRCMKMMYERDENAKRLDAALARVAELEKGTMYVEARQCDECQHGGINDSADGLAACHDCDWTGPEPDEDKCPGCHRENCMTAACPACGGRYVLVASDDVTAPVAQAQHSVPEGYALIPTRETEAMHDAVMALLYKGVARTDTQKLLDAYIAAAPGKEVPQAWHDVQAERRRQITAEGWTPDHDDLYCAAELPRAAAAYILSGANDEAPAIWPFSAKWWKPRDARANYMRAGALILAEIERLDRAAAAGKEVGHE